MKTTAKLILFAALLVNCVCYSQQIPMSPLPYNFPNPAVAVPYAQWLLDNGTDTTSFLNYSGAASAASGVTNVNINVNITGSGGTGSGGGVSSVGGTAAASVSIALQTNVASVASTTWIMANGNSATATSLSPGSVSNLLATALQNGQPGNGGGLTNVNGSLLLTNIYAIQNTNIIVVTSNANVSGIYQFPYLGGVGVLATYTDESDGSIEPVYTNQFWCCRLTHAYNSQLPGQYGNWVFATNALGTGSSGNAFTPSQQSTNFSTDYLLNADNNPGPLGGDLALSNLTADVVGNYSPLTASGQITSFGPIQFGFNLGTNVVFVYGQSNVSSVYIDPVNGNDTNAVLGYASNPFRTIASAQSRVTASGYTWYVMDGTNDLTGVLWKMTNAIIYCKSQNTILYSSHPVCSPFIAPQLGFSLYGGFITTPVTTNFSLQCQEPQIDVSGLSGNCIISGTKFLTAYGNVQGSPSALPWVLQFVNDDISGGTFNIENNQTNGRVIVTGCYIHPRFTGVGQSSVNVVGVMAEGGSSISGTTIVMPTFTNAPNGIPPSATGRARCIVAVTPATSNLVSPYVLAHGNNLSVSGITNRYFANSTNWFLLDGASNIVTSPFEYSPSLINQVNGLPIYAGSFGTMDSSNLTGTVPMATNSVALAVGNLTVTNFSGNLGGGTNLNASKLIPNAAQPVLLDFGQEINAPTFDGVTNIEFANPDHAEFNNAYFGTNSTASIFTNTVGGYYSVTGNFSGTGNGITAITTLSIATNGIPIWGATTAMETPVIGKIVAASTSFYGYLPAGTGISLMLLPTTPTSIRSAELIIRP